MTPRTLPLRRAPLPGESLTSWLNALARLLDVGLFDLTNAGVPQSVMRRMMHRLDIAGLRTAELEALATIADVDPRLIEATSDPLRSYATAHGSHTTLAATANSPYCPQCLDESDGVWLARWRLPVLNACKVHRTQLVEYCPDCSRHQRFTGLRPTQRPVRGWECDQRVSEREHGENSFCRGDLRAATAPPASDAMLEMLDHFGPLAISSDKHRSELHDELRDLVIVARLINPLCFTAPSISVFAALASAWDGLRDDSSFATIATTGIRSRPFPLPSGAARATDALVSRLVAHRDPYLRPIDRLRWRSPSQPSRPPRASADPDFARLVPVSLWSGWTLRIFPTSGLDFDTRRTVGMASLHLVGTASTVTKTLEPLPHGPSAARMSYALGSLAPEARTPTLRALVELAEALREHGSPIDYQRRWQTFHKHIDLSRADWERICRRSGLGPGGERRHTFARLWLWETLTGAAANLAPPELRASENYISNYVVFQRCITEIARRRLLEHARKLMDAADIHGEPVEWSPPRDWVHCTLAGIETDTLPADQVVAAVQRGDTIREISERHDLPPAAVTFLIRRCAPSARFNAATTAPDAIRRHHAVPEHITAQWIDEQRAAGLTLRILEESTGVLRGTLASILREEGHATIQRRRLEIDADWLRAQYVDCGRTLPDIAAELGTTPTTVAKRATEHGIQLRSRGGASHAISLEVRTDLPTPLRQALSGRGAAQRLQRFQVIARFPSMNQASAVLQIESATLTTQTALIERSVGEPILERSSKAHAPQQLTDAGRLLLQQVDEHFGPHPLAPDDTPEPLRTALRLFRGRSRCDMYVRAAQASTLTEAAQRLGTTSDALRSSLILMERRMGLDLFDETPSASCPLVLSDVGTALLRQARTLD